jgi:hypothetical protein
VTFRSNNEGHLASGHVWDTHTVATTRGHVWETHVVATTHAAATTTTHATSTPLR